jgi:hypothetical protein
VDDEDDDPASFSIWAESMAAARDKIEAAISKSMVVRKVITIETVPDPEGNVTLTIIVRCWTATGDQASQRR